MKFVPVHRLVAIAFIPNKYRLPQVNHIDGVKINNHVDNLEWTTALENAQHAFKMGLKTMPGHIEVIDLTCGFIYESMALLARSKNLKKRIVSEKLSKGVYKDFMTI